MTPRQFQRYLTRLGQEFKGHASERVGMKRHTTFKIGGMAAVMVWPRDLAGLEFAVAAAREMELPVKVLGAGSNLLVGDGGVQAVVIKLREAFPKLTVGTAQEREGRRTRPVTLEAGVKLIKAVTELQAAGLTGLEWAAGIPGTAGGAAVMNAGSMGAAMADLIEWVEWCLPEQGRVRVPRAELDFAYRRLRRPPAAVVTACGMRLIEDDPRAVRERINQGLKARKRSQPLAYPSAGSVFKNPPGDYAGRLIEAAGLKGERIGDAQISDRHANFIVNRGRARSRDVLALIARARERVARQAGIELELEIELWGEELP
jgi:UDP-N-acetylmuramate dehydrogenase